MMSKKNEDKSIVIVGGGYVGSLLTRELSAKLNASKYDLIMINERPYTIHLIAAAHMTVFEEGRLEDSALIPYNCFHKWEWERSVG
ncbi:hypothetical protein AcW1_007196 [Taiwanofungus camphoratus]|nr:hypothetical protein AcW2_007735 [Antrodia cinnamomea]KAI0952808.1 hypothetical protein AcW1_007196 [Antrodia cinnamomea]